MRRDVHYYFQKACRRQLRPLTEPMHIVADENVQAGFAIRLGSTERIDIIDYRCTTCVTLVALCEHLAEELRDSTVEFARSLTAAKILALHPEIPLSRGSRAHLAVAAVHAALENTSS
jgi:hypothetical protein